MANTVFAGPVASGNGLQTSAADALTATASGTQTTSLGLTAQLNRISTAASGSGVTLPASAPIASSRFTFGVWLVIVNDGANAITVFGNGSDTVNDIAGATGISQPAGSTVMYVSTVAGKWYADAADAGAFSSLTVSGSFALAGVPSQSVQTVTAAGATQASGTPITKALAVLTVVTASARGVRLPSVFTTGQTYRILSNTTQGCKIFPGTGKRFAGVVTNASVVLAGFKGNTYTALNANTWVVQKGA